MDLIGKLGLYIKFPEYYQILKWNLQEIFHINKVELHPQLTWII